ncbi:hemopexin-like [Odontesthes bonariensis]|uniref:hemopexin-like n=1 Tax=Odontesthes bonariensis TaxID=219752 RepID=UPI003F589FC5
MAPQDILGPIYLRLDTSTGLRSLPITRAWIELGDQVDAAYFYSDKEHLIRGDQVWAYQPDAPFALIEGYPKTVKEELGFEGYVDAAFMCPNEQTLYVFRGTRMLAVDLTAATRAVTEQLPFPVDDIDASLCDRDGVKIFKRSHYYQYENARVLAMSKIAPVPLKITSAILGCKD